MAVITSEMEDTFLRFFFFYLRREAIEICGRF